MKRALVPITDGFEEIEAVTIIDLLRRAGVDVVVAGLDGASATGSHGITISCDCVFDDALTDDVDAVVLPGGMPGTTRLLEHDGVGRALERVHDAGGMLAAVCAAPTVLHARGFLDGKRATCHPAHAAHMTRCQYSDDAVVVDGNIITSRGAGTSIAFTSAIIARLAGDEAARDILERIVYAGPYY